MNYQIQIELTKLTHISSHINYFKDGHSDSISSKCILAGVSTGCVATYLTLITYRTKNISCYIEEMSVEPSDMTDMKENLLISL